MKKKFSLFEEEISVPTYIMYFISKYLNEFSTIFANFTELIYKNSVWRQSFIIIELVMWLVKHLTTTLPYEKSKIKFVDMSKALMNNEYHKLDKKFTGFELRCIDSKDRSEK